MSDDFAKKFAEKLERERSEQHTKDEKFVQREALKKTLGPLLWGDLRDWLERTSGKINMELGKDEFLFENSPSSELFIRYAGPPAHLHLTFDSGANRLHCECSDGKGEYIVEISDTGEAYFRDPYHRSFSIEEIGQMLLAMLRKSRF